MDQREETERNEEMSKRERRRGDGESYLRRERDRNEQEYESHYDHKICNNGKRDNVAQKES